MIAKHEGEELIRRIRDARAHFRACQRGPATDRCKLIFLALDVAELMAADLATEDYVDPRELVNLGQMVEALDLWKAVVLDRIRRHPEAAELFR